MVTYINFYASLSGPFTHREIICAASPWLQLEKNYWLAKTLLGFLPPSVRDVHKFVVARGGTMFNLVNITQHVPPTVLSPSP